MKKYIDAEGVMRACYDSFLKTGNKAYREIFALVEAVPAEDVQEVVRCGECKHLMQDGRCYEFADDNIKPSASDYCSYGERKEEKR